MSFEIYADFVEMTVFAELLWSGIMHMGKKEKDSFMNFITVFA